MPIPSRASPADATVAAPSSGSASAVRPPAALFQARGLRRAFGSLQATDDVSLDLLPGEIHALIGPNGAGKSTLIQLLAGSLAPDAGTISLAGTDLTTLPLHRRVAAGVSRSFQITTIFKSYSVRDNLLLAVQARTGSSFRFWSPRVDDAGLLRAAQALAAQCMIDPGLFDRVAGTLPHGEQRKLEFALALAAQPRILLLDEPMAGMGPDETLKLTALIESLRGTTTMLLVEHDMDAVFRLADRISVLVYGKIIACGTPEQIRQDAAVRQAYLGDDEVGHA